MRARACVTRTDRVKLSLAGIGFVALAAIAVHDPAPTALTGALFAAAWWLRRRLAHRGRDRRRHVRHVRRHVTTVALLTAVAWTLIVLAQTTNELSSLSWQVAAAGSAVTVANHDDWPGTLLVEQVLATGALALAAGGLASVLVRQRARHHASGAGEFASPAPAITAATAAAAAPRVQPTPVALQESASPPPPPC